MARTLSAIKAEVPSVESPFSIPLPACFLATVGFLPPPPYCPSTFLPRSSSPPAAMAITLLPQHHNLRALFGLMSDEDILFALMELPLGDESRVDMVEAAQMIDPAFVVSRVS